MARTPPIDPENQLARFREAVDLLGGQRATARYLGCNERTVRALANPHGPHGKNLHDGHLRDLAAALIEHAEKCRAMERLISPAFAGNLTQAQLARMGKPDARRFDQRSSEEEE